MRPWTETQGLCWKNSETLKNVEIIPVGDNSPRKIMQLSMKASMQQEERSFAQFLTAPFDRFTCPDSQANI